MRFDAWLLKTKSKRANWIWHIANVAMCNTHCVCVECVCVFVYVGRKKEREGKEEFNNSNLSIHASRVSIRYKPRRSSKRMLHTVICVCKHILKNVTKYVESRFCHFLVVIRVNDEICKNKIFCISGMLIQD